MKKEVALKILEETKKAYDAIAEDFSRTRKSVWKEFKILAGYVQDNDKVLDLGCGNGRFAELFSDKKIDYIGMDISEKLIEIAERRYPDKNFQVFDGLKMPSNDESFDKVFYIAVLHHIPGADLRREFLKEIKRILKPGGKLILTVFYLWQKGTYWPLLLKFSLRKILGRSNLDWLDITEPYFKISRRYFHLFRKNELKKLIGKIGFKIDNLDIITRGRGNKNLLVIARK